MRPFAPLLGLVLFPGLALAQDPLALDAHGFSLVPSDGDLQDYLSTWRAERQEPGSVGFDALAEYAYAPFVLVFKQGDEELRVGIIEHLLAVNLGVVVGVHERLAVAVSGPVYLWQHGDSGVVDETAAYGPALGDLRLAVPIHLVLSGDRDGKGSVGVSVVPFGVAPTGPDHRGLGQPGFGGGGLVAIAYDRGPFDASVNLGAQYRPRSDWENLSGGADLLAAVGVAYALTERVAVRLEANAVPNLVAAEQDVPVGATEVPVQAALSTRAHLSDRVALTAGLGTAATRGTGAAPLRVFVGLHGVVGKVHAADQDGDGFADRVDGCPDDPEVVNGYRDDDGCPDTLAALVVEVVDPNGAPIRDAAVSLDGDSIGVTDAAGLAAANDRLPETTLRYGASAAGFVSTAGEASLVEGAQTLRITLPWAPRPVRVITRDPSGAPVAATLAFEGEPALVDVGADGQEVFERSPGEWTVTASSESHESASARLVVVPGTGEVVLEIVMQPRRVTVTLTEIVILEQILFDFDKATIRPESSSLLDEIAKVLVDHPYVRKVEAQGHTSDEGSTRYNADLSERRMVAVVDALVARGVDRERLVPRGYGEEVPLFPNDSDEHRAANRRVQFVILEQDLTAPE